MKKFATYYSFLVVSLLTLVAFLRAASTAHIISAIIFFPLFVYFAEQLFPRKKKLVVAKPQSIPNKKTSQHTSKVSLSTTLKQEPLFQEFTEIFENHPPETSTVNPMSSEAVTGEIVDEGVDANRRMLLKMIVSAGTGLFVMSIFTKKAHAAFFGSVPGPGTISIKDSNDEIIDPAIKTPTDGFKISEVDDSSSPAYYGFVDKNGAWFIMKEDSAGAYRYTKGSSSFSTSWTGRAGLTYGYFDSIF